MSEPSDAGGYAAAPTCYRHPDRPTGVRCSRCDRPICPQCMIPASVGFQCPECVNEGRRTVRTGRTVYGGRVQAGGRPGAVTMTLIGVNVAMFIITSLGGGLSVAGNGGQSDLFTDLALNPVAVGHGQWYRLVSAMFLHFNVLHIGFNMYALYLVGPPLEAALGRARYLTLYFLAGLGGSVLSVALGPLSELAAGASGAIFGLFGAFYIVARHQRWQTGGIAATIVLNLVLSFSFSGEIDWRGHVGGLIAGSLLMLAFAYAPSGKYRGHSQALGLGAVALIVALVGYAGAHRARSDCPTFQESDLSSGLVVRSTGCPASGELIIPGTGQNAIRLSQYHRGQDPSL
ncbi:MAG TPA: rhomboid family intramembrane serine protease [Mycobacteriales bacterium]|nr:rhomboid family intramembrane serine protease [Mycobacteriales bacterium]